MKIAGAAFALLLVALPAHAQNVKITSLGSHPGELCANDRAMIFEDPTGVRFLFDAGQTLTGGDDPRLGTIHLVLLSHMHGDHVGDSKLMARGAGTCANSLRVPAPNSTTAEVVAAKHAVLVTTRAMAAFIHNKVAAIRGSGSKPMDFCNSLTVTVPVPEACSSRIDLGGSFTAKAQDTNQSVEFTIVYAAHVNDVAPSLLSKAEQDLLKADGAQLGYGPPVGFVVKFTNGLTAYLSADTAVFGDMKTVIHDFYKANLAVINLGPNPGLFQTGAFAINDLLKPASVIFTHVNEAATEGGKLRPNTQTAALMKQITEPAYLAISERTMEFDGKGKCVSGC
ncbi:MAG TPA: MBL fold metallo-hydrolase [Xanthobacteraceae bacterium]|nr:MBL fold metallo-hydrolase [Xanthobacteraceae bacterium]